MMHVLRDTGSAGGASYRSYADADAIGSSPAWRAVVAAAMRVAATEATVVLLGESGTGKEVVARLRSSWHDSVTARLAYLQDQRLDGPRLPQTR